MEGELMRDVMNRRKKTDVHQSPFALSCLFDMYALMGNVLKISNNIFNASSSGRFVT
jgi:hypothetical protein